MAEILLAVESSRSRAPQLISSRLLNYMTERQPPEAKGQAPLFNCPGIRFFSSTGSPGFPCRGGITLNGTAYFVQGQYLVQVNADGNAFVLGSGISGTLPVGMAQNGLQLIIVNGVQGWTYSPTAGFQLITDTNFAAAKSVSYTDGYFLFEHRNTNQWFISGLFDGRTYSPLDFASAEGAPGNVVAIQQNLQLVFVFCTDHIELWYDAGTPDFPFARYTGGLIPYGTISPYAIVKTDGALFMLGADHIFYRLNANQPVRVSTHSIERRIEAEPDLAKAEAFTVTIEGHKLIFLTLPTLGETLCYDISTGRWHERDSVDENFESLGRYRARVALEAYDTTLLGDAFDGRIGVLDFDFFQEYTLPMYGLVDTVTQHADRMNVFCGRFELDVEAGVGLTTGQGSDPKMMLRRSVDGNKTFGAAQPWRSMGKQGEFAKRLVWRQKGKGRQLSWRIECTDPVRRVIIAAHADLQKGYR